jgi:4-amino-4-deoxy-L-arabinose transferase-like glycosyltransferase
MGEDLMSGQAQRFSREDLLAISGLWLASVLIAFVGLGNISLVHDEPIVARVALEISRSGDLSHLLRPTLWGEPYFNKPPFLHLAIAIFIRLWRVLSGAAGETLPPEWVIRAFPAFVSTFSVPLVAITQRILLPGRRSASYFAAFILLITPPFVTHGRLAMLDGVQVVCMGLLWLFLLLAITQSRFTWLLSFLAGLAVSGLLLLKPPAAIPVFLVAITLTYIDLMSGATRRWSSIVFFALLGLLPGILWHLIDWYYLPEGALRLWWNEGLARPLGARADGNPLGWPFLFNEFIKGGVTWLVPWFAGVVYGIKRFPSRWSIWALGLSTAMVAMALLPRPHHPHYSYLLWYPFALIAGFGLALIVDVGSLNLISRRLTALSWIGLGVSALIYAKSPSIQAGLTIGLYNYREVTQALALPLLVGAFMVRDRSHQRRLAGVLIVGAGWIFGLAILLHSQAWNPWGEPIDKTQTFDVLNSARIKAGGVEVPIVSSSADLGLSWYLGRRLDDDHLLPGVKEFIYLHWPDEHGLSADQMTGARCQYFADLPPSPVPTIRRERATKIYICAPEMAP